MARKTKNKRVKRRKRRTKKNTGRGSGASKPYKPVYSEEQVLLNQAQNIYGNIMMSYHRGVLFNNLRKKPNESYAKMYGLIVNDYNKKKIEKLAWEDALDQVFGTTTDDINLDENPNEASRSCSYNRKRNKRNKRKKKKKSRR